LQLFPGHLENNLGTKGTTLIGDKGNNFEHVDVGSLPTLQPLSDQDPGIETLSGSPVQAVLLAFESGLSFYSRL
jgi:hypothetical protein